MHATLETQKQITEKCEACGLCQTRTHVVFGDGDANARVMIIGEAPGKNEDETGTPFVGAAGKKLDALLELAGLRRDEVYIANVLKCRPPKNRNPSPQEILACAEYLRDQVRAIQPEVLVCLGNFATQFILKTHMGITGLRGNFYKTGDFLVLPIFHPAAAIYDNSKQEALEDDFKLLGTWLKEHPHA